VTVIKRDIKMMKSNCLQTDTPPFNNSGLKQ